MGNCHEYVTKASVFTAILDALAEEKSVFDTIGGIPPADVKPVVRGRWEKARPPGFSVCSVCHDCYIDTAWATEKKWRYCPTCGAEMALPNAE